MKIRIFLLCLALVAVIFPCQLTAKVNRTPQDSGRTLAITGVDFNKKPYSGTLEVIPRPIKTSASGIEGVTLKWNVGGAVYQGIGVITENILTATWGGNSCSLVVYAVEGRELKGIWTATGLNKIGTEIATLTAGKGIGGSYNVNGTNVDGSPYKGTLEITERGPVYQFSWNVGSKYEGIGIKTEDLISVAWGGNPKDVCGVAQYLITDNGLEHGTWGIYGNNALGSEQGVLK